MAVQHLDREALRQQAGVVQRQVSRGVRQVKQGVKRLIGLGR